MDFQEEGEKDEEVTRKYFERCLLLYGVRVPIEPEESRRSQYPPVVRVRRRLHVSVRPPVVPRVPQRRLQRDGRRAHRRVRRRRRLGPRG